MDANVEKNIEYRILNAACRVFLLYGFHGTTMQEIAAQAEVRKSMVHYYFRSKENLYQNAVRALLGPFPFRNEQNHTFDVEKEKLTWFFTTELYNNHQFFVKTLEDIYFDKSGLVLHEIVQRFSLKKILI